MIAAALGMMHFDKVGQAGWFAFITPFHFGTPIFDPVLIVTMVLVMIVTFIELTGMFLALSRPDRPQDHAKVAQRRAAHRRTWHR